MLTWSMLLSVALIVYELTTEPVLGVVVVCIKFGWKDFLIAYWLWRVDANRPRARTFFWILLASGLAKIVFSACLLFCGLTMVWIIADAVLQVPQPAKGLFVRAITALATFYIGSALIAIPAFCGFWCAYRSGIKVYLPLPGLPELPPGITRERQHRNASLARLLILASFSTFLFITVTGTIGLGMALNPQGIMLVVYICLAIVTILLAIAFAAKSISVLEKRVITSNPLECWGTDVVGTIMSMRVSNSEKHRLLAAIPRDYWRTEELAALCPHPEGDIKLR